MVIIHTLTYGLVRLLAIAWDILNVFLCFFGCFEIAKRIKDQFQWNMISAASMKPCTVLHCIPLSVKFIVIADKTSLHQSLWTWKIEDVTRLYYVICVVLCGYVENKANQKPQSENRTPQLHCLRANAYKHT